MRRPFLVLLTLITLGLTFQPGFARTNFRFSEQSFANTGLGPVLARAAYMQTYEYNTGEAIFQQEFARLHLWISFRGDARLFAIFSDDRLLVTGIRSHRPDAVQLQNRNLREFVIFNPNLHSRAYASTFYLFESETEDGGLQNGNCREASQWPASADLDSARDSLHPGTEEPEWSTPCKAPVLLYQWLEFLRQQQKEHRQGVTPT